ncbi:MAG: DEAD/DEAH box helicase family protein [Akkermansia sp.]|nr:DEAD/DEAH box helicase family protein [Akkermansia sp.]
MKFQFKIQEYQTEAVQSVVDVFAGQMAQSSESYMRDLGRRNDLNVDKRGNALLALKIASKNEYGELLDELDATSYRNGVVTLHEERLLENVRAVQARQNLVLSDKLVKEHGVPSLDVEMETGTGKTYCYIKTMFELNRMYGWTKFIVVVPGIAIREGVKKSFEITADHFMEQYGKKVRFFVYNSKSLHQLDSFSASGQISVMIINMQAFASSMKEGAKNKESRIIYTQRDEFQSRRPIDVIAANHPIIIMDEPQKMGGKATQEGISRFKPLFVLNYSATHKNHHTTVYVLDALDAFNKQLVKKIQVKGFEIQNLQGVDGYLYVEQICLSTNKPPRVRMLIEVKRQSGSIGRKYVTLEEGDSVYTASGYLLQYKGYTISEIDVYGNKVEFTNGISLVPGQAYGDVSETDLRRIQIRETIASHIDKESELFHKGIKCLSLFFLDKVENYRKYDDEGNELPGEFAKIFEEEYNAVWDEKKNIFDPEYMAYVNSIEVEKTHTGYFSIDKKGRCVDSEIKRGTDISEDISAYDLILKNKERLLSFEEPTRFIFSHSALREGWDNPNVFQICALKQSNSIVSKRQEVGRGLRLCVNKEGTRMDADSCGADKVHELNCLTVVASESYATFVGALQNEIKSELYDRPTNLTVEYLVGKCVKVGAEIREISMREAERIMIYLDDNEYVDEEGRITTKYREEREKNQLADLPEKIAALGEGVHIIISSVFDPTSLKKMTQDAKKQQQVPEHLDVNENFYKKEFQDLWKQINHKYTYTVHFDSDELVEKAARAIDNHLLVSQVTYSLTEGTQGGIDMNDVLEFVTSKTKNFTLKNTHPCSLKYDLVGQLAKDTVLTRRTIKKILERISQAKLALFALNPEEFISKVAKFIKDARATMIVEKIEYNQLNDRYEADVFTAEKHGRIALTNAMKSKKHVQDFVITDGSAEMSVERRFAMDLEAASEVCVYAKLPRSFKIPTPVGNYSPDWAIAFNKDDQRHIFFVAETKGSMDSLDLRPIEQAKICCAKKLFSSISTAKVHYHEVDSYQSLMNIVNSLKE